jgi:cytochrome c oxidase subunit II
VIVEEETDYHAWLEQQQTFAELSGRSAVKRATYKSGGKQEIPLRR